MNLVGFRFAPLNHSLFMSVEYDHARHFDLTICYLQSSGHTTHYIVENTVWLRTMLARSRSLLTMISLASSIAPNVSKSYDTKSTSVLSSGIMPLYFWILSRAANSHAWWARLWMPYIYGHFVDQPDRRCCYRRSFLLPPSQPSNHST